MKRFALLLVLMTAAACATRPVNLDEPRRVVGTENDVRVDAEVYGDRMSSNASVSIKYDITNNRATTIAVADIVPETTFDPETRVITVNVGSEVPGTMLLPRLVTIAPGEKKSFSIGARTKINIVEHLHSPMPNQLRVKVNFLADTAPFEMLLNIQEKAVNDAALADKLFPIWVERNEAVVTNTVPMRWDQNATSGLPADVRGRTGRRP